MEMQCETDVLFSSNFGWFSASSTFSVKDRGGGGVLLNGQNPLNETKVICRRSLSHMGRLGPGNYFWGNWAKIGLSSITLQPFIRFSQTSPHFV